MGNTSSIELVKPDLTYIPSYLEARAEGPFTHMALGDFGEATMEDVAKNPEDYIALLNSKDPRNVETPSGDVFTLNDHEIFWIVKETRFLGGVSFRFDKNCPIIDRYCGHVGMGLRASILNKGYGIKAVEYGFKMGAEMARSRGLDFLLASASPNNRASYRLIEHMNGELISTDDPYGWGENRLYKIHI